MNQRSFVENIRDFGVTNLQEAENYLRNGPLKSYTEFGFGLNWVATHEGLPIGMCGLIKRPILIDVDIGFGFLAEHTGKGYATEAARAILNYGLNDLKLQKIVAITSLDNGQSINVLEKLGFVYEGIIKSDPVADPLKLFSFQLKNRI